MENKCKFWLTTLIVVIVIGSIFVLTQFNIVFIKTINLADSDKYKQVEIPRSIADILNQQFQSNTPKEYVMCLRGFFSEDDGTFHISYADEPKVYSADEGSLQFGGCSGDSLIGTVHSHTEGGSCELSKTDTYSMGTMGIIFACVQCEKDTFGCYTPADFNNRLPTKIISEVK